MGQMVRNEVYTPLDPDAAPTLNGHLLSLVTIEVIGHGDYWNPCIARCLVDGRLWLERVLETMP